jgi:hypothetical protein
MLIFAIVCLLPPPQQEAVSLGCHATIPSALCPITEPRFALASLVELRGTASRYGRLSFWPLEKRAQVYVDDADPADNHQRADKQAQIHLLAQEDRT